MTRAILILNAGSSSLKFAIYPEAGTAATYHGEIEGIGHAARMTAHDAGGALLTHSAIGALASHNDALAVLLEWIKTQCGDIALAAAGHRIVHGGREFTRPALLTPDVVAKLEALTSLAPLHQPHNLAPVKALAAQQPDLPQIGCFDTEFHATQPAVATAFALPRALTDKGLRRYGFHGLSYEYIASILPDHLGEKADGKVVIAHLGQGASMCAMQGRKSIATTMGFSTLDGLMMGTRCGALDPGVLLYLLDREGMSPDEVSRLLYDQSGLLGVSGISNDMRELLASMDARAAEAVELFVYRIVRELGSLVAALQGLDAIVFTGGIGQNAPDIRARVCKQAAYLGIKLDDTANRGGAHRISQDDSTIAVLTLKTNEEYTIARHTRTWLAAQRG
ncbi:MAG TPA: acetate/propionate family kinase [Pseudolabrys sp.]|nr:acetate/propionate family kinase [Pseudolabrys sp.]